jgi:hypothetical protein
MLLEREAVIDAHNNDGKTALYFAIGREKGYTHALQSLPELGADINVVTGENLVKLCNECLSSTERFA